MSPYPDTGLTVLTLPIDFSASQGLPIPDAITLCHDLVTLLEGPVPPALGHIRLLQGFLQLLAQSLALLSKDFYLLVGSPSIHCHCVFDLGAGKRQSRG